VVVSGAASRKPPPTAPETERVAYAVREAMGHPATRELLSRIVFASGGALNFSRHDAYEAGKRDYARAVLALLRRYAPEPTAEMVAEYVRTDPQAPAVKVDAPG